MEEYTVVYKGNVRRISGEGITFMGIVNFMRAFYPVPYNCHIIVEGQNVCILKEKPPQYDHFPNKDKMTIEIRRFKQPQQAEDPALAKALTVAADIIADSSREAFLREQIDKSLKRGDEDAFMQFSSQLKELLHETTTTK